MTKTKLSDLVSKYSTLPPSLEFKAGDNTDVKLWFDLGEVLDFCSQHMNTDYMVEAVQTYLASMPCLKELMQRLSNDQAGFPRRNSNPPLNYQIRTRIEKSKEVHILPAKSSKKRTRKEYFLITDFVAEGFIQRFEELAQLKVRPDRLQKTAEPIREKTIDRLVKGTLIERRLVDLILHGQTIPSFFGYRLRVEKNPSQCQADVPNNTLCLGGKFHIEFFNYGPDL